MKTVYHPTIPDLSYEVDESVVEEWKDAGWRVTPLTSVPAPASKYDDLKLDELKQEIDERNDDGRDDDAKLAKSGNKAELIAALVADDQ